MSGDKNAPTYLITLPVGSGILELPPKGLINVSQFAGLKHARVIPAGVTVALNQAENNRLICFIGMHLAADFAEQATARPLRNQRIGGPD